MTGPPARLDRLLRGVPGVHALARPPIGWSSLETRLDPLGAVAVAREAELESLDADDLEVANAELVALKDAVWAVRPRPPLHVARRRPARRSTTPRPEALGLQHIQLRSSTIDRLEVRGHDSAGVHVFVWGHDIADATAVGCSSPRGPIRCSAPGVVSVGGCLSFVYKAAAEIGELGDTHPHSASDRRRRPAPAGARVGRHRVAVLGHTRWASVGIISNRTRTRSTAKRPRGAPGPYVVGSLNGDVDNHHDLARQHGLHPAAITTDAKVIPTLVSPHLQAGHYRSVASAGRSARSKARSQSALPHVRPPGSRSPCWRLGQGLYIGLADDTLRRRQRALRRR